VTINTDDPPMVGTDLSNEYAIAARLLDLDTNGVIGLALAAVDASFASSETKAVLRTEISSYAATPTP
jgi:aminodeoxyfutalosine deaminase